jgi:CRP-like cAMP-binding protein
MQGVEELVDSGAAEAQDGMLEDIILAAAESTGPLDKLLKAIDKSNFSLRVIDVFNALDADKSRALLREEVEQGLRRMVLRRESHVKSEDLRLLGGATKEKYEKEEEVEIKLDVIWCGGKIVKLHSDRTYDVSVGVLSEGEITELLTAFDLNGDGEVNMQEFMGGMKEGIRRMTKAPAPTNAAVVKMAEAKARADEEAKAKADENAKADVADEVKQKSDREQELKAARKKMIKMEKGAKAAEAAREMAEEKARASEEAKQAMEVRVKQAEEKHKEVERRVEEERQNRAREGAKKKAASKELERQTSEKAPGNLDKTAPGTTRGQKKAQGAKASILAVATKGQQAKKKKKKEYKRPEGVSDEEWEWQRQQLQSFPFFKGFSETTIEALATQLVHVEQLQAGEYLLRRGDPADKVFFIKEGQVEVMDKDEQHPVAVLTKAMGGAADEEEDMQRSGEGSGYFGEMALIPEARRTATVRIRGPSISGSGDSGDNGCDDEGATNLPTAVPMLELYSLNQAHVHQVLDEGGYQAEAELLLTVLERDEWLVGTLLQAEVFAKCSIDFLHRFAALVSDTAFESETVIFKRGDPAPEMYLVYDGAVEVIDPFDAGSVKEVLGPGQLFGETAALTGMRRTATVRATDVGTGAVCLVIGVQLLDNLLVTNPEYRRPIARLALSRLETNEEDLITTRTWRDARHQERRAAKQKDDAVFNRSRRHLRAQNDGSGVPMHDHVEHMKLSQETSNEFKLQTMDRWRKAKNLNSGAHSFRTARENTLFARQQLQMQLEEGENRGEAYMHSPKSPINESHRVAGAPIRCEELASKRSLPCKGRTALLQKEPSKLQMLFNSPSPKTRKLGQAAKPEGKRGLKVDGATKPVKRSEKRGLLGRAADTVTADKEEVYDQGREVMGSADSVEEDLHDVGGDRQARSAKKKRFFDQMARPKADPAGRRFDRCGRKVVPPSSLVPVRALQRWIEKCGCDRAVGVSNRLRGEWDDHKKHVQAHAKKSRDYMDSSKPKTQMELLVMQCGGKPADKQVCLARVLPHVKNWCLKGKYDLSTSRAWDEAVVGAICAYISSTPRLELEMRELRAMGGKELDEEKGGVILDERLGALEQELKAANAVAGATVAADIVRRLGAWLKWTWQRRQAHASDDNTRAFARADEAQNCKFIFERSAAAARAMASTECGYDFESLDDGSNVVQRNEAWLKKQQYDLEDALEDHARVIDRAATARDCNDPSTSTFLKRCAADQEVRQERQAALETSILKEQNQWRIINHTEHGHGSPTKQRLHTKFAREPFLDRVDRLQAEKGRSQLALAKELDLKAQHMHSDTRSEHEQRMERDKNHAAQEAEARSLSKRLGLLSEVFEYRPGEAGGHWQGGREEDNGSTAVRYNELLSTHVLLERLQHSNKSIDPGFRLTTGELHVLINECIGTNRSTGGPVARKNFCRHVFNRYGHFISDQPKKRIRDSADVDAVGAPYELAGQIGHAHNMQRELGKGVSPGPEGKQKSLRAQETKIFRATNKAAQLAAQRGTQGTPCNGLLGPNQRQRRMTASCVTSGRTPRSPARR